jgi:predicted methyltransferase
MTSALARSAMKPLLLVALGFLVTASGCGGSPAGGAASASTVSAAPPPVYTPVTAAGADPATDAKIRQSLAGPQRADGERARDGYRHPVETLELFGLREDMTVVELVPGGGWYTAVLAPVLRERGKLVIAGVEDNMQELLPRIKASPVFDKVQTIVLTRDRPVLGPPGSADMVVTFRNFHNWVGAGATEAILAAAFAVLKHGGVFGLTDHRANRGTSASPQVVGATGYVPEDAVVQIVESAGFQLAAKSEVNANPRDTKDYPKGVWTLPPVYALGANDHAKYEAIGESDRMTLKFVKP